MTVSLTGLPQRKILVVDDEPGVCRVVAAGFETTWPGVQIDYVPETSRGAQSLRGGTYDLALIDSAMNDHFGLQLAKRALTEKTPVLLMSDNAEVTKQLALQL